MTLIRLIRKAQNKKISTRLGNLSYSNANPATVSMPIFDPQTHFC